MECRLKKIWHIKQDCVGYSWTSDDYYSLIYEIKLLQENFPTVYNHWFPQPETILMEEGLEFKFQRHTVFTKNEAFKFANTLFDIQQAVDEECRKRSEALSRAVDISIELNIP